MTLSNGNIFRVTGPLCGESTGHRWIPRTNASDAELWCFFICAWINGLVYNREAGDLRRHRAHYDVTVMTTGNCHTETYTCRIWSWSPMPCEKHGPRDSVDKNWGPRPRFFRYLGPRAMFFTWHGRPWSNPIIAHSLIGFAVFYSHKNEF